MTPILLRLRNSHSEYLRPSLCLILLALFSASAVLGTQPATVSSNALELSTGWFARRADEVLVDGTQLTTESVDTRGWLPAVVPGTVLTTLLENGKYPDPNIGMNNARIPDIADVGAAFFTYWFYTT